jgi:hypothetical protein
MHLAAAAAAALSLAAPALAGPQRVQNARVESRSAASGLAAVVKAEIAGRPGPLWIGWAVPTQLEHSACCWSSWEKGEPTCRGCRLEGRDGHAGHVQTNDEAERLEGSDRVRILLRAEAGSVGRIRAVSEDCPLDAGGLPFVWIEGVRPAESVALLVTFVGRPRQGREGGKHLDDAVTTAIAFHGDPSADAALERFLAVGQPLELRKQAAFWMGQARGSRGYQALKRVVREDEDRRLREHAIFALSQSREPGAVDTIIEAARRDPDAHVRGQALFWLAQTAARRAPDVIRASLDDDPELEVKKKAVFALSQLPKDEGVPLLMSLARTHRSSEVRKQAMFWLGQSGDPRALAFFEDILGR